MPLFHERYDLVIPVEYYESDLLALLQILREPDSAFKQAVQGMGGYGTDNMGKVLEL